MANGTNISSNSTISNAWTISWYWWLCGAIAVITVLGNFLVIVLIITRPSLRTIQNWFVLSLAVADFLIGVFIFPLRFVFQFIFKTEYGVFIYKSYDFLIFASMTNLSAMTFDRYLYILHPLKYNIMGRKANVLIMIVLAWFLSFLFPLANLLIDLFMTYSRAKKLAMYLLIFGFKGLLCLFLTTAYGRILYFSRRLEKRIKIQASQLQHNYPGTQERPERSRKSTKMIRALGCVIGFFLLSCICNIFDAYFMYFSTYNVTFHRIAMSLVYANSAVNVFIYGLFKRDFRHEIKKISCLRRHGNDVSPQLELN